MYEQNLKLLEKNFPNQARKVLENNDPSGNTIETSKSGSPTLKHQLEGNTLYVHSKYNPIEEAERFINQYSDIENKHVLFIGNGLGYYLNAFLKRFNNCSVSIYEPSISIFKEFISLFPLNQAFFQSVKYLCVNGNNKEIKQFTETLVRNIREELLIIKLQSYERIFVNELNEFHSILKKAYMEKAQYVLTDFKYQKRWTINSIKNFQYVISSPNILHQRFIEHFQGKPAIIVSAGPSLNDEIENLKKVKSEGLAYIFAAGSSLSALIEHDIYPDAVCIYDPQEFTQMITKKLIEKDIGSIPLIFGSSVGYEIVKYYPGKKFHMITNQDTISQNYLKEIKEKRYEIVEDAPSIAVVTFQLLSKLKMSPIILVGQNLAYLGEAKYASGIEYYNTTSLKYEKKEYIQYTQDVNGNEIATNIGFNLMRESLEYYIESATHCKVINTTRGGAKINGAPFKTLESVINTELTKNIVDSSWSHKLEVSYDIEYLSGKHKLFHQAFDSLGEILTRLKKIIKSLEHYKDLKNLTKISKELDKLDRSFKDLLYNDFYKTSLLPMLRVQTETFLRKIDQIRMEKDLITRSNGLVQEFTTYILDCEDNLSELKPHYFYMKKYIDPISYPQRLKERYNLVK